MDNTLELEELAEIARIRAFFYALLNTHFLVVPDLDSVKQIRSEEFSSLLKELASGQTQFGDLSDGARLMLNYLQATAGLDESEFLNQLSVDRTRLYRGIAPGYGPPPPCEAVWIDEESEPAQVLQGLVAVYRQSGLFLAEENRERADYIGVELHYLHHLAQEEAEAWQAGQEGRACGLLVDQNLFLSRHAGRWLPAFVQKAVPMAGTDFFKGHLAMLAGFLAEEEERIQDILCEIEG